MPGFSGVQFDPMLNHLKFYDANNKGWYATEAALNSAWPTAQAGNYAVVGTTDTVWVWDTDTTAWINSTASGTVTSFNGRTGVVTPQAGDYTFAMIGLSLADTQLPVSGTWDLTGNLVFKDDEAVPNTILTIDETNHSLILSGINANATTPALAFGDGDTGFYESADDNLSLSIGASNKWRFSSTILGAVSTTGAVLRAVGADFTIPSLIARSGNDNTGIGSGATDQLSLIAGGVEGMRIVEDTTIQAILPLQNNATKPSLAFGDGDTGFYESADDLLAISIAGALNYAISATHIYAVQTGGASLRNIATSSTVPGHAFQDDSDTGIGRADANQLSLITGGVEAIRIDASQKVGLGIAVPLAKLHINGGTGLLATGIAFGDGDTGFYENTDDSIYLMLNGAVAYKFQTTYMQFGASGNAPGIMHEITSATNPVFVPERDDSDTGIGRAGANQLSLIAGGVELGRIGVTTSRFGTPATNYSEFEVDGTLKFVGNATVWNDENIGTLSLGSGGTKPGTVEVLGIGGVSTGVYTLGFDTGEEVSGFIEIPHSYKEGSDFQFHIHFSGNSAPTGTDKVKFQLEYFVVGTDAVIPAPTIIVIEKDYDTQYERVNADFSAISGAGIKMGDQLGFTLSRIAASVDEYAGDALTETIGIHFEANTVGSRQIFIK